MESNSTLHFILWFDSIGLADISHVGGKNASLGELVREISTQGVRIPDGFAITAEAYRYFIDEARLGAVIDKNLRGLDPVDTEDLNRRGHAIRDAIRTAPMPKDLELAIIAAHEKLCGVKRCFASLFTDRAIAYRFDKNFDVQRLALSVGVQRMVRSDLASSGD